MPLASQALSNTPGRPINWWQPIKELQKLHKPYPARLKLLNIGREQKLVDSPYDQSYNPPALAANLKSFRLKLPFSQPRPLSLQITA